MRGANDEYHTSDDEAENAEDAGDNYQNQDEDYEVQFLFTLIKAEIIVMTVVIESNMYELWSVAYRCNSCLAVTYCRRRI